jgi:2-keto-myo-inositol isomerase
MKSLKACLNQDTLRSIPTASFLSIAKKTGFGAVELTQDKVEPVLASNSLKTLTNQILAQGLTVASINGPENFNLLNDHQFSEISERTGKLAQAARELNCNLLVPVPSPIQSGVSRDEMRAKTAESLAELADTCGEDINLGLEFLGIKDCSVNSLKDAVEIVKAANRKNVGLVLDSFHLYLSDPQFTEMKELNRDRVLMVHVNDSESGERSTLRDANRLYPGEGVIDLKRFGADLLRMRYDGFLSLELLRPSYWEEDPEKVATIGRESLRKVFGV